MGASSLVLIGCAQSGPPPLYTWRAYPQSQYETLLNASSNPESQIQLLEEEAESAKEDELALPPGFRAHLGMLHLSAGNPDRAKALWLEEKAAFPESARYMDKLLERLDPQSVPASQGE